MEAELGVWKTRLAKLLSQHTASKPREPTSTEDCEPNSDAVELEAQSQVKTRLEKVS